MLIGQPAEEEWSGRIGHAGRSSLRALRQPDFVLAEHDSNDVPAGSILKGGPLLASATPST
jgi:hypothetical protein